MNTGRVVLMIVMLLGAAGCASLGPSTGATGAVAPSVTGAPATGTGWWYARFFIELF